MKKLLTFFLLLLASVWVGLHIEKDPGYVLIAISHWTIETPLWFAVVLLLITYLAIRMLSRLLGSAGRVKSYWYRWQRKRQSHRSHHRTRLGLIEFSEGNWKEAEDYLIRALPNSDTPLINYLTAARAAQEQGASKRRDGYLREAQQSMPDAKIAVELTQAQLQIANEQWEQALATLNHLHDLVPKHPYVLKLLVKLYRELSDWQHLAQLLSVLKNRKIFDPDHIRKIELEVYAGLLRQAAKQSSSEALCKSWGEFPKHIQQSSELLGQYASQLIEKKQDQVAEECLRKQLKRDWSDQLATLYGECIAKDTAKQLSFLEGFLKQHAQNSALYLALGKICKRQQLWGKSRNYLEQSVALTPTVSAYCELAQLLENLDEQQTAFNYYKQGLLLSTDSGEEEQS